MLNIVKNYGGHLLAYLIGLADIVSKVSPSTLPPQYAVLVTIAGLIGAAAHHGYTAGNLASLATAALNAAGAAAKTGAAAVLLCLLVLTGAGCASNPAVNSSVSQAATVVTSAQAQPIITAAADVAVATAEAHGISATQINSIASQALAADSGTAASLAEVGTLVNQQLAKLNLPPADLAAAQVVEIALGAAIQAQVGNNATAAQTQAAVADILKAIIAATAITGPPATATPATTGATTAPASSQGLMASVESPTVVGAAAGTVAVWALKAFAHVTVSGPVAAAGVVLWTVAAAYLKL